GGGRARGASPHCPLDLAAGRDVSGGLYLRERTDRRRGASAGAVDVGQASSLPVFTQAGWKPAPRGETQSREQTRLRPAAFARYRREEGAPTRAFACA